MDSQHWRFSGDGLRRARTAAGLTRTELAYLIQRGSFMVGRYERGECTPPPHIASRMAVVLGVDALQMYEPVQADA